MRVAIVLYPGPDQRIAPEGAKAWKITEDLPSERAYRTFDQLTQLGKGLWGTELFFTTTQQENQ